MQLMGEYSQVKVIFCNILMALNVIELCRLRNAHRVNSMTNSPQMSSKYFVI